MKRYGWMALLGSLLALVLLAGIGYLVYQAGVAQGAANGLAAGGTAGLFFGPGRLLTWILGFLALMFAMKIVMRLIFFPMFTAGMGRRFGRWGHYGPRWPGNGEDRLPPFFQAWHERAHAGDAEDEDRDKA